MAGPWLGRCVAGLVCTWALVLADTDQGRHPPPAPGPGPHAVTPARRQAGGFLCGRALCIFRYVTLQCY